MNKYNKVITEVLEVLENTEEEIVKKIPQNVIEYLKESADNEYVPNIDFSNDNWEDSVMEETKDILAVIYVDYICSEEERQSFLEEEQKENKRREEEKQEKFNYENLFKRKDNKEKNDEEEAQSEEQKQLVDIKTYPWYKRIYYKILEIFGKRKK